MDSILDSIKKLLGPTETYTYFDPDIILHINTVFAVLNQLGVGPQNGFMITGSSETWSDYLSDAKLLELVKTYVYLKVKLIFDPPLGSSAMDAVKSLIDEMEWRIIVAVREEAEIS